MADIATIMTEDESGSQLVDYAHQTAAHLVRSQLTRAQIRNIFTEVRKIEDMWDTRPQEARRRLNMLKPKLDYQTSRHKSVAGLRDVLIPAIVAVDAAPNAEERDRRFRRFVDLFEAILAYHRAEGGRN
jgi:CRISPR-associated protein Csm2